MPGGPGAKALFVHDGWEALMDVPGDLLLLGVIVAVLGLALVAYYVLRVRRTPGKRFRRLLRDQDEVAILLHPNPDPDAMATGFATAALAKGVDTKARILYPGQLRHHENRAFRTVLEVDLEHIDSVNELIDLPIVLVDHGRPRGFPGAETLDPIAVIDHHDEIPIDAAFLDARPDYGACSTILTEYLRDLRAHERRENGQALLDTKLATALAYGIHTDTNNLTRGATFKEFEAFKFLYPMIDDGLLDRIANPSVEAGMLDSKARAIQNRIVRDCYCVSDMGSVEAADVVPMAADELLRLEGIESAVAIGDYDGMLYVSGRSIDDRVHIGTALERVVEKIPGASAGGHARMGGAQSPIEAMEGIGPTTGLTRDELIEEVFAQMREGT
ncbi:MAG: DHH family phosphoesterase [Halobacteriota archaeon]